MRLQFISVTSIGKQLIKEFKDFNTFLDLDGKALHELFGHHQTLYDNPSIIQNSTHTNSALQSSQDIIFKIPKAKFQTVLYVYY